MKRVGIVGCGAIGSGLALALEREYADLAKVVALCDARRSAAEALRTRLASRPPIVSLPQLIRRSDLVIEAASVQVAARVATQALAAHREVLVMSTGGLLDRIRSIAQAARRSRGRLYLPSGALAGLDGVKALAVGTIRSLQLTTRKPPTALGFASLRAPKTVFTGSPSAAVRRFPQNTNIAATMMLAASFANRRARRVSARVRVIADPSVRRNTHELAIDGDCGRITVRVESDPSRLNPKTSELAVRSALATLAQLFQPVRVGT